MLYPTRLWLHGRDTSAMIRASIVIPTLNEENYVGSLLSDIASQTRKAHEVIVVDGNSQDATASVVERFPGVDLISGSPPWLAKET
jgi:cellulose synthase/poly-beta-1,6-N-acetylglucosamine synthase-like glycosyltransferase